MTVIAIVNKSTLVTPDQAARMTNACAWQLLHHGAPAWGVQVPHVELLASESYAAAGSWVIAILDDADQAGDLGWHTEASGDRIYGRVFARPVLDNGGDVLGGALTVSSVLSHELLETMADPHCNLWADGGQGTSYACEIADPVESGSYAVAVPRPGAVLVSDLVQVSNFVLPSWFDPQAGAGAKVDWLGTLTSPFELASGGYYVTMTDGQTAQQFGNRYPEWRRATKLADTSRTARRVTRTPA